MLSGYLPSLTTADNFCHGLRIPLNLLFAFGIKHQMDVSHGMQNACCPGESTTILKSVSKREAKDLPVPNALR